MANPVAVPGTNVPAGAAVSPGGSQGLQGLQGVQGVPGPNVVSTDSGNEAKLGSDNKVWVPIKDFISTAGGTVNAIILTNSPPVPALVPGMVFSFNAASRNTGAVTISVDGLTAYQLTYNNGSVLIGGELLGYTTVVYVGGAFALVKGYADDRFSWRSIAQFQGSIACSVANTQYACPIALTATLRGAASDFAFTSNQVTPIRDGMISFYMSPDRASTNTRLIVSNSILTVLQDTGNGTGTAGNAIYNQVSMPCCSGSAASVQVLSGTPCNVTVNGAIYLF